MTAQKFVEPSSFSAETNTFPATPEPFAGALGFAASSASNSSFGSRSILLQTNNRGRVLDVQIRQNFFNFSILFGVMRIGNVRDVQQQRRFLHLFQRRAKRRDQGRGSARINPTVSESKTRRPEGKRTARTVGSSVANIFDDTSTPALLKRVEQSGLSGIRISDQRYSSQRHSLALFAAQRSLLAHHLNTLLYSPDSSRECDGDRFPIFVRRDLGSDSAAQTRKLVPLSRQPWQQIIQLRQFNLQADLRGCAHGAQKYPK